MKRSFFSFLALLFFCIFPIFSQVSISTEPHIGNITDMVSRDKVFYTVGTDGFIIEWNQDDYTGEHFQASDLAIHSIALQPNTDNIAIYETDGFSIYRVSVWNWKTKQRLFAKRFSDSVLSISYSEKGTYLMVGTASFEGMIFLDSKTGAVASILQNQYGNVLLSKTGKSENSSVIYTSSGSLIYINLSDGTEKAKFDCQPNLQNSCFFDKSKYLVGYSNNNIYVIKATSGETLQTIPANNPIFLISDDDSYVSYIEKNKTEELNSYQIKYISLSTPKDTIHSFMFPLDSEITSAIVINKTYFLADSNGNVYISSDIDDRFTTDISVTTITQKNTIEITDIGYYNQEYYFLTSNSLFKSTNNKNELQKVAENNGNTNILIYKDSIILWSKNKSQPVYIATISDEITFNTLFESNGSITSMNCENDTLVYIVGNSKVYAYSFLTEETNQLYSGSGLQDVLLKENTIYVAKTSATNPKSALISIDLTTQETVQLPVSGDIIFSLAFENNLSTSNIFGISVSTIDKRKTELFKYSTSLKQYTPLMQWADEDTEAITFINGDLVFTNIGKTNLRIYNLKTKKTSQVRRNASLPKKVSGTSKKVAILNKDGSITWYMQNSNGAKLSTYYLSVDNQWLSF